MIHLENRKKAKQQQTNCGLLKYWLGTIPNKSSIGSSDTKFQISSPKLNTVKRLRMSLCVQYKCIMEFESDVTSVGGNAL